MAGTESFWNLRRLLELRQVLAELSPDNPPDVRVIAAARGEGSARLALLAGSYNPPTSAHVALAEAAIGSGMVDALYFSLGTRTIDKERVEGMSLDDRLLVLEQLASGYHHLGVALLNRGLYVDQAEIVRRAMPSVTQLWFVMGFDKIVQIFDPAYYADRDPALDRLFQLSNFLVAPRGSAGSLELRELLARPANAKYAAHVGELALPATYRDVSSTRARAAAREKGLAVPRLVKRFINETSVYAPPLVSPGGKKVDRYEWREKLVGLAASGALPRLAPTEFASLWRGVVAVDAAGAGLRAALARGDALPLRESAKGD